MGGMAAERLVPADFAVPHPPPHASFEFEVLGPEHNASDLTAWTTSMAHIHASPGWSAGGWPDRVYTLEENRADLERHRDHHERGLDFAWTVLAPGSSEVIGCVYLKPDPTGRAHGEARSWVRADRAALDRPLREHLAPWFERAWPFAVRCAPPA
jgi:RimJ/RimL family protein N-acetyltransferase